MRAAAIVALLALACPGVPAVAKAPAHALCATAAPEPAAPYLLILSAFPAELSALVEATAIDETIDLGGRRWHVGRLNGVHVVLGLMGIGLVNAEAATRSVLGALDVAAVVVNGVGGSPHRIGDVVVATRWMERDRRRSYRANPALLALARRAAAGLAGRLGRCALVPPAGADPETVCMAHEPQVVVGGRGASDDPFDGAFACMPGGGDVFGCELPGDDVVAAAVRASREPIAVDMETAAVARVAREHRVPFLGVRGVSDGAGDPLGDRGFPLQFFDYYQLAADNAARVTRGVVAELACVAGEHPPARTCRLLDRGRWRRAARRIGHRP